jgi:hypothetical protein
MVWQKTFGGANHDYAYSILQLSSGNYVCIGNTNSYDGDVTGYTGDFDGWCIPFKP